MIVYIRDYGREHARQTPRIGCVRMASVAGDVAMFRGFALQVTKLAK